MIWRSGFVHCVPARIREGCSTPAGLTQAGYEAAAIVEVVRQARLGAPRKASRSLKPFFGLSQ
jgi:hypothetical protein